MENSKHNEINAPLTEIKTTALVGPVFQWVAGAISIGDQNPQILEKQLETFEKKPTELQVKTFEEALPFPFLPSVLSQVVKRKEADPDLDPIFWNYLRKKYAKNPNFELFDGERYYNGAQKYKTQIDSKDLETEINYFSKIGALDFYINELKITGLEFFEILLLDGQEKALYNLLSVLDNETNYEHSVKLRNGQFLRVVKEKLPEVSLEEVDITVDNEFIINKEHLDRRIAHMNIALRTEVYEEILKFLDNGLGGFSSDIGGTRFVFRRKMPKNNLPQNERDNYFDDGYLL